MPLLPVPSLQETLAEYVRTIKPLLNQEEYKNAIKDTQFFEQNVATELQDLLLQQYTTFTHSSWLNLAWLNAYLKGRETVSIATNFTLPLKMQQEQAHLTTPEVFLSTFIAALGSLSQIYIQGKFPPIVDTRGQTLCLSQFEILRGASRIPEKGIDSYHISHHKPHYITIFYKNQLFKIDIFDEEQNILDASVSIQDILQTKEFADHSLSSICFANNDKAATLRQKYIGHNTFFPILENSLFNISIFSENISSHEEKLFFSQFLQPQNTWIYKPLNFIYNLHDQSFHIHCEHTYQDGGTILEIIKQVKANMQNIHLSSLKPSSFLKIQEYFDEEYIKEANQIQEQYRQKITMFAFKDISVNLPESDFNTALKGYSKDGIMQILLQYAQYKTFNTLHSMYEAVDMRGYQNGRTECLRSISEESVDFIKQLDTSNQIALREKLKLADSEHKRRIKRCKKALGVDRHLYGLSLMINKLSSKQAQTQARTFFDSMGYQKLSTNFLSTSSIGYAKEVGNLLFAPVTPKGLGINYNSEPYGVKFIISYYRSEESKVSDFIQALKDGTEKIKALYR